MEGWEHKDEWWKRGKDFLVVVKHSARPTLEDMGICFDSEGPHLWNVYAYIYPNHKLFPSFDPEGEMFQDATQSFPLHCGCTFFEAHERDGKVISYQIGSDYNHIYDTRFSRSEPPEDVENFEVFRDAQELYEWLSTIGEGIC